MCGVLDRADSFELSGWAAKDDRTADSGEIEVDGSFVAGLSLSIFRNDMLDHGFGDGRCGFRFIFPECLGLNKPVTILVRSFSTGKLLNNGTRVVGYEQNDLVAAERVLSEAVRRFPENLQLKIRYAETASH